MKFIMKAAEGAMALKTPAPIDGYVARYTTEGEALWEMKVDEHIHEEDSETGPGVVYVRCNAVQCGEEATRMSARDRCLRYTLDGECISIGECIMHNEFSTDEIAAMLALEPGEEMVLGGGAAPERVLRVEEATR